MKMNECEHEFRGFEYSKLLERWVTYCHKCGLITENKPMSERLQRAIDSRIRNGDIVKKGD